MFEKSYLKVNALGMAMGVTFGLGMLLMGLVAATSGVWVDAVDAVGKFYLGFTATVGGSIIGAVWGFIDGYIGGAVVAWFYNKFQK